MVDISKLVKDGVNAIGEKERKKREEYDRKVREAEEAKAKELEAQGQKPERPLPTLEELARERQQKPGAAERLYENPAVKTRMRDAASQDRTAQPEPTPSPVAKPVEREASRMEASRDYQKAPNVNGLGGPGGTTWVNPRAVRRESLVEEAARHERAKQEAIAAMTPDQRAEYDRQEREKRDRTRTGDNSRGRGSSGYAEGREPQDD